MDVKNGLMPMTADMAQGGLHAPQLEQNSPQTAAKAFEEMLISQLFRAARKSMPLQGKDFGHSMFQEMFDEQLAQHIADQGLGIGDMIEHDFVSHVAKGPTKFVDAPGGDKRWPPPLSERGEER